MIQPIKRDVHWEPPEDNLLRELALSGETAAEIARQLNRSVAAVRARASRLTIKLAEIHHVKL